jgi:hypothetical protein
MWFRTFEGLSCFGGYEFKNYRHSHKKPHFLQNDFTKKLLLDSQGNLWVTTQNGLANYNPLKDNFTNYNKDNSDIKNRPQASEFKTAPTVWRPFLFYPARLVGFEHIFWWSLHSHCQWFSKNSYVSKAYHPKVSFLELSI